MMGILQYKMKRCSNKECGKQCRHDRTAGKNTQNNTKTRRTPRRNRHSEKGFFVCFLFLDYKSQSLTNLYFSFFISLFIHGEAGTVFINHLKSNVYVTLNAIGSFQCNLCSHWLIQIFITWVSLWILAQMCHGVRGWTAVVLGLMFYKRFFLVFLLRQQEEDARRRLLDNPVKMKRLQMAVCKIVLTLSYSVWNSMYTSLVVILIQFNLAIWNPGHSFPRTFVPTDIRSHAIFDRARHSCSHLMTTLDIRAHIKWPPGHSCSYQMTTRTFVLISNDHPDIRAHIKWPPGHSCSYQMTTQTFVLTSNDHPDIRAHIKWPSDIRAHIKWPHGHSCSHQMTTRTFVLISNDHLDIRAHIKWPPRHSSSYQLHFIYLFFTCLSPPTNRLKFKKKVQMSR